MAVAVMSRVYKTPVSATFSTSCPTSLAPDLMPRAIFIELPAEDPLRHALPATCTSTPTHVLARDAEGRLELRRSAEKCGRGIHVDFSKVILGSANALRRQPLVRAIGDAQQVFDATAGLLTDAWLIAASGCRVFASERDPFVFALGSDGLSRANASTDAAIREIASRIALCALDAARAFAAYASQGVTTESTAVLLDPMFPPKRKKSALPPKEMQILKELLGEESEEQRISNERSLLATARTVGVERIVVKRPDHAGDFAQERPSWSLHGMLLRFDVYAHPRTGVSNG